MVRATKTVGRASDAWMQARKKNRLPWLLQPAALLVARCQRRHETGYGFVDNATLARAWTEALAGPKASYGLQESNACNNSISLSVPICHVPPALGVSGSLKSRCLMDSPVSTSFHIIFPLYEPCAGFWDAGCCMAANLQRSSVWSARVVAGTDAELHCGCSRAPFASLMLSNSCLGFSCQKGG